MDKEVLDKEKQLAKQEKTINKTKWLCMSPGCTDEAINSHLLQQHGVLSHVAESGHLYELGFEDFFKWHDKGPAKIRKVGLKQAISYPLFCNKHDTEIFAPIEGAKIDFDDYRSQLLFSYRAVCSEIRKKDFVNMRYGVWDEGAIKESHAIGTDKGRNDMLYYKYLFERELEKPKGKFSFIHLTYPFMPIYACGSVSFEPIDYKSERSIADAAKKKVWDGFFISIVPQSETIEIIIGYHNNHVNKDLLKYIDSWEDLSEEQLQVKLSDLFTARLETWGMAPSLYEKISEDKRNRYMSLQEQVHADYYYDIRNELSFNLFSIDDK